MGIRPGHDQRIDPNLVRDAGRTQPAGASEWLARTVPGAIARRTGLGHFGDPDADTVERLTWLTAGAG
jgi:hypothetical protein